MTTDGSSAVSFRDAYDYEYDDDDDDDDDEEEEDQSLDEL